MESRRLKIAAAPETLSPWWQRASLIVLLLGLAVLSLLTVKVYRDAPPIPKIAATADSTRVFTDDDVSSGQQVFLKYGLMDNGSIWGHGAYLGPDYSAEYLHTLALASATSIALQRYGQPLDRLTKAQRAAAEAEARIELKQNHYDSRTGVLVVSDAYKNWFGQQAPIWEDYFSNPANNGGLTAKTISDPTEIKQLTAFVAWAAWASVANRPNESYSYTNNFPFDPLAGNTPTSGAVLWSALSLISLLGGTAIVLLAFGKFDFLGWKPQQIQLESQLEIGVITASQRATLKFFAVVALLFLGQTVIGGGVAHYRADPSSFYGFNLAAWLPSNLLRTWHLQLAIFWIATAYVAGALFLAAMIGESEPAGQTKGINVLFGALLVVVAGSLLGEWAGIKQLLPNQWFWFGNQGWEYLELGRVWQILLAIALLFWFSLLVHAVTPALRDRQRREIAGLFLFAAIAIPIFYLPAMFFGSRTHFSIVDTWRFWIIHLWVEGFFEFFATVLVAIIFFQLRVVNRITATRVIYLDAILYFGGGLIGTGHHWYWSGQTQLNMALSALFSALEVVPLTLITLDAWGFVRLTRARGNAVYAPVEMPHKWTFYFLMAVGFWNFVGAGVFGFLINLPIISYFEVGTQLTPNHGHAAMMGVFGMLAMSLITFAIRQTLDDTRWLELEKYIRISFWGINIGLMMMVAMSLLPGGVMQLMDVLEHGYWHARSLAYTGTPLSRLFEWLRLPGDMILIVAGALPMTIVAVKVYFYSRTEKYDTLIHIL